MDSALLLQVPALLARQAQLEGNVVAKVELLLACQVVGAVQMLYRVVQAIFLQQGFAFRKKYIHDTYVGDGITCNMYVIASLESSKESFEVRKLPNIVVHSILATFGQRLLDFRLS